ncbi:uncharacterized protein (TIGR02453 family) [Microbacterium sp. AK009]|uniref:DUF2461 domain-containing protein n=1 Tax=Microbacterium sp. AK009 TaxID=2723068 RepID=UPI0015CAB485|nr:DUF2461 domain-containing protein [Microbacterium sp. AK009]NYF17517.1 uncharacterized protein (TIGR02453 family) [Microbacterium sp. AK009]
MSFDGLNPAAPRFYDELAADNTREWWLANKARYDAVVRAPFEALAAELEPEFGQLKIFRPNRDVRFSADKSPYKLHIGMVSLAPVAYYLQLSATGLLVGGGSYDVPPAALARFRELVDDDRRGPEVEGLVSALAEDDLVPMSENALRTAPRGYSIDHPRIGLLRLTHLAIGRTEPLADWMWGPEVFDIVSDAWRGVGMWNGWLSENLGDLLIRPDRERPGRR